MGDERIDFILFAEYNSFGSGVADADRANFSTVLTRTEAAQYTLPSAIPNYSDWVDADFLLSEDQHDEHDDM